jgi:guanidinopropionase
LVRCADLGDCPVNPADLQDSLARISGFYGKVRKKGIVPMTAGGDHLVSLPVLRGLVGNGAPVAMIHFDAHTDFYDSYFGGFRFTHGTPFRRAAEEGLIDTSRVVQIGIRGTAYDGEDVEWARSHGVRIFMIEEVMDRGSDAVMAEAREIVGDQLCYVSFDIDGIDPSQAPGTGTPEIGGFSTHTAQRMVRRLQGLNLMGADLVEVSPPFDPTGMTAWVGVSIIFELLCVLADAVARRTG